MPRETLASLREKNATLQDQLAAAGSPITNFNDSRLEPLLTAAHAAATDANHCGEYDEIMEAIGAPVRIVEWSVSITVRTRGMNGTGDVASLINDALNDAVNAENIDSYDTVSSYDVSKN